jgi:hypothetical protein
VSASESVAHPLPTTPERRHDERTERPLLVGDEACRNGHLRTPENTYIRPGGGRCCRDCKREANRRWRAANPEKVRESRRRSRELAAQTTNERNEPMTDDQRSERPTTWAALAASTTWAELKATVPTWGAVKTDDNDNRKDRP